MIDHFARIGMDGTIRDCDVDNLCRLARHKLVSVKVSAFYALGRKKPPYTDLGPMIRRLLDAFGPERLMWASDCPFQVDPGHTYRDSIDLVRERLDFLSAGDKRVDFGEDGRAGVLQLMRGTHRQRFSGRRAKKKRPCRRGLATGPRRSSSRSESRAVDVSTGLGLA